MTATEGADERQDALRRLAAIESRVAPIRTRYDEAPVLTPADREPARRNAEARLSAIEARSNIRGNAR